jgi:hypothetical protein
MKIIINENTYNSFADNEIINGFLDKLSNGRKLSIDEKRCMDFYSEYLKKGGNPSDFRCPNMDDNIDEREGETFTSNFEHIPEIKFTFSEETSHGDEIHYFGELTFNGSEYLGIIAADDNGYLVGYDFYDVNDEEGDRFQDVVEGLEHEVEYFFSEMVIPKLISQKK